MSTVGLNFGSLSSGTGFDVAGAVTSILAISGAVETPWKTQLTTLQAQDTALSTIGTDLSTLSTAISALTSFDGVFYSKLGSSSDTNTLSLTAASSSSTAGSHTVLVNSLASTSSDYSDRIANKSDTLSGSLQIQIGSGTAQTITLGSTDTLASLAATINAGGYGVTANVVTDTQGSRLSLVSQTSGTAGQITLTSNLTDTGTSTNPTSTPISFTQGQPGADASLTVDGLATTSASNTVTTAIPGVTFQLLNTSATPVQIQITNDNSSIETAFQTLVTAYNAVVTDLTTQEGKDSSGNPEPLFGSATLSTLQTQLSQALFGGAASGTGTTAISSITQLGLSVGTDGKLALTSSSLDTALNENFSNVLGFLQTSGSFGQNFTAVLNSLGTTSATGVLYLAQHENSSQEANLNTNISNEDALLAAQKTSLTKELNAANQILQSLPTQLQEVDQIYSAETGYNTGH